MTTPITLASTLRFICFTGKSRKPIFECIHIMPVDSRRVRVHATDGEVFRAHEIDADNNLPARGAIVSGKAFKAAVGKAKVLPYIAYSSDGSGHIKVDGSEVPVVVGESYPQPPAEVESSSSVSLARVDVANVEPATDKEGSSPSLSGIAIYALGPVATCAATDGRLLIVSGPNASEAGEEGPCVAILPESFYRAVCAIPGEGNGTLSYSATSKRIALHGNGFSIIGRRVDATYPRFHGALNQPVSAPFPEALDALACIVKASEGLSKKSRGVAVGEHGAAPMQVHVGGKSVAHPLPSLAGKPIALNAAYVASVMKLNCTSWTMSRGLIGKGPRVIALIMPIHLPDGHAMAGHGGTPLRKDVKA